MSRGDPVVVPNWARLRKLGFKPDKRLRDRITKALQGSYHPFPIGWRPLLERYVEQEAGIHVHLRYRRGDDAARSGRYPYLADHTELCATFEWPDGPLFENFKREPEFWRVYVRKWPSGGAEAVQTDERADDVRMAVLATDRSMGVGREEPDHCGECSTPKRGCQGLPGGC